MPPDVFRCSLDRSRGTHFGLAFARARAIRVVLLSLRLGCRQSRIEQAQFVELTLKRRALLGLRLRRPFPFRQRRLQLLYRLAMRVDQLRICRVLPQGLFVSEFPFPQASRLLIDLFSQGVEFASSLGRGRALFLSFVDRRSEVTFFFAELHLQPVEAP